jgi:hypothetical protein
MYDVRLDRTRPQPARQPEAVAASFIGDDDPLDFATGSAGFVAPLMQQLEQHLRVGL